MKMAGSYVGTLADVDTLAAVIAHSQIVVVAQRKRLPAGFDEADIAILDWIISESRHLSRSYLM